jgi:hypothetical protein
MCHKDKAKSGGLSLATIEDIRKGGRRASGRLNRVRLRSRQRSGARWSHCAGRRPSGGEIIGGAGDVRTGAVGWTGDAAETMNVDTRDISSVMMEMSHAVESSLDRLVASLSEQLLANNR